MFALFYRYFSLIGRKSINIVKTAVSMLFLFFEALGTCINSGRNSYSSLSVQLSRQILYSGVEAFWLVAVIAFLCGGTIVIQAMTNMPRFGVTEYFGNILIVTVVREIGPYVTAFVVVGRSGTALAAYLGSMKVNKEVAALEMMGVDPVYYLVVPALIGMTVSMICLNVYFDIIAIIGGLIVAKITVLIPFQVFLYKVLDALSWIDIVISFSKGIVFGIIIAVISSYNGLAVKNIRNIPQATIDSVVGSMSVIIISSVIITVLFYAR